MRKSDYLLLFILAALQFNHIVDFMILMPLGEKLMATFDVGPGSFSRLLTVYAGAAFVSSLITANYVDRIDRRTSLLIAHVGFTIGTVACGLAGTYTQLFIARGVAGAFGGLVATQVLAIVGDYFPLEKRGRAMGIVMMAFSAASVVGVPAGIAIASMGTWRTPFLVLGAFAVVVLLAALWKIPHMRGHITSRADRVNLKQLVAHAFADKNQLLALIFTIVVILGHFTVIPFIAPYMQINLGFTDGQLSLMYAIGGALTVVSLPLIGRCADAWGAPQVFTVGSITTIACILTVTHLQPSWSLAAVLVATSAFFVTSGGRTVPALTIITSVVPPQNRGGFMSLRASFNQLGMGLASFLAGLIISEGPHGELLHYDRVGYLATAISVIAIWFAWRIRPVA